MHIAILLALFLTTHKPHGYRVRSAIASNSFSMTRQNQEIDRLKLPRIVNDNQLHQLIKYGELERIPENETIQITANVLEDRRYVRSWTKCFVVDMANSFYNRFNKPLVVDSAVRTVEQQQKLRRVNKYAAPETGRNPSSHLAGITVDLAKRRYSTKERRWIVAYLKSLKDKDLVVASEEPQCFHVAVFERYYEVSNAFSAAIFTGSQ